MAAFSWTDPKTGIKYTGPEGQARWVAYNTGKPFADKGVNRPLPLGPPPVGTYDPAIDYNADASQRGFEQTRDDSSTAYEQGQQDYGLGLGDLTTGRDRRLQDITTSRFQAGEDLNAATNDLRDQFGILGRQQSERAAQQGIQSQGLLGQSAAVRAGNQAHGQSQLQGAYDRTLAGLLTDTTRTNEDFTRGKLGLDLGNARTFGGYGGNSIANPLTGQPAFGSLLTNLTRSGGENNAFQIFSGGQRASQAAANGYTPPTGILPTASATSDFLKRQKAKQGLIS